MGRNDWLPRACVSKHYINVMVICHATQLTQGPRDNSMVSRDSVVVFEKSPRLRRPTYKSSSAYGHSLLLVSSDNYANEALAWQLAQCSMLSCIFSAACPFEECHVVFLGASNGTMSWEMGWEAAVVVL